MRLVRNPPDTAKYLACLQACFPGWGGNATFDWVFRRTVGEHPSDLMIVELDGEWIAGSGVSYRPLLLPGGGHVLAGIMTGSWTLPAARGRGCFTRIIDESIAFVREKRGGVLLAFVTESNASYRRLAASGAGLFPTRYLFSTAETPAVTPVATEEVEASPALVAELSERAARLAEGRVRMVYRGAEWEHQLVRRADPTTIVHAPGLGHAIVEVHGEFDRLQAVLPVSADRRDDLVRALLGRAQSRGQKLFLFASDADAGNDVALSAGLGSAPGFITANVADADALAAATKADVGQAEEASRALAEPGAPSFLGRFALQTGDRM